jgi:N-acylneuraminate cytidylyltransferase
VVVREKVNLGRTENLLSYLSATAPEEGYPYTMGIRLAVIPARGGSKRIRGKNIRDFLGRPIIAYSIEACIRAARFDRVIVSTDSDEIASVAVASGAEVPFKRPGALADDHTPMRFVIEHARQWFLAEGLPVDSTACVLATVPLLTAEGLARYFDEWYGSGKPRGFTVCAFSYPPQRGFLFGPRPDEIRLFMPELFQARSQDLPTVYHDAGLVYFRRYDLERDPTVPFISPNSHTIVVGSLESWDIDTEEDWQIAEALFRARRPVRDQR